MKIFDYLGIGLFLVAVSLSFGSGFYLGQGSVEPIIKEAIIEKPVIKEVIVEVVPDWYYITVDYPELIELEQTLEILAEARFIHQYYFDREIDVEHHLKWIKRYDQLRQFILGGE